MLNPTENPLNLRPMLIKLLWRKQPLWQILGASFGALAGTTLLLLSLQVRQSVNKLLADEDELFPARFLTISKKVSLLSNLPGMRASFSKQEINKLRNHPGTVGAAPFRTAGFQSVAVMQIAGFPAYQTELFLESIPAEFLESLPPEWNWKPGDSHVPILLPNSFLHLYNFGFAPANAYPQISKGMVNKVGFTLHLQNKSGKSLVLPAKIAAFSDRITTILVPETFMLHASSNLEDDAKPLPPYRILLKTQTPIPPELRAYLTKKNYEANKELLKDSKVGTLAKVALGGTGGLGLLLLLLAFLAFWLSFQVLVQRSAPHLRTLLHIGYPPSHLARHYLVAFLCIGVLLCIVAATSANFAMHQLANFAMENGIELDGHLTGSSIFWATLPVAGLLLAQCFSMRITLEKLARS